MRAMTPTIDPNLAVARPDALKMLLDASALLLARGDVAAVVPGSWTWRASH